ncbi:MAG: UvrD-helicase domain-containing protein, partial [Clostridia bacterium]|nr:UvrD-helicase domain-containing protein [Clostridia bacterium]
MGRNYTEAQLRAIESKAKRLLVCAAAGSGKTTVLTERILRYVSDPDTPGSLSRLIVVTFTRAAAAELRDRIRAELEAEFENNPTEHLTHEILSIAGARISTIHSFCYDLIRAEGEKLGISRNVRLVDEIEDRRLMLDT